MRVEPAHVYWAADSNLCISQVKGGRHGYLPHEILGQNALHFVPTIFRDFAQDALQQALRKVGLVSYRLATYGRSGELIWNENRVVAVRKRGRICGFVALSTYVNPTPAERRLTTARAAELTKQDALRALGPVLREFDADELSRLLAYLEPLAWRRSSDLRNAGESGPRNRPHPGAESHEPWS